MRRVMGGLMRGFMGRVMGLFVCLFHTPSRSHVRTCESDRSMMMIFSSGHLIITINYMV